MRREDNGVGRTGPGWPDLSPRALRLRHRRRPRPRPFRRPHRSFRQPHRSLRPRHTHPWPRHRPLRQRHRPFRQRHRSFRLVRLGRRRLRQTSNSGSGRQRRRSCRRRRRRRRDRDPHHLDQAVTRGDGGPARGLDSGWSCSVIHQGPVRVLGEGPWVHPRQERRSSHIRRCRNTGNRRGLRCGIHRCGDGVLGVVSECHRHQRRWRGDRSANDETRTNCTRPHDGRHFANPHYVPQTHCLVLCGSCTPPLGVNLALPALRRSGGLGG